MLGGVTVVEGELFGIDAAENEGDGKDGEDGQNPVGGGEGGGRQFAQHDVVAAQIGEKEEAEGAFTVFGAEGVGREEESGQQAIDDQENGESVEKSPAEKLRRGLEHCEEGEAPEEDGGGGRPEADPKGGRTP